MFATRTFVLILVFFYIEKYKCQETAPNEETIDKYEEIVSPNTDDRCVPNYLKGQGCDGSGPCPRLRVRRDVRTLNRKELNDLFYVFSQLKIRGVLRDLSVLHASNSFHEVHGRAQFFPWHRLFLLQLETEMRKIIPDMTLPYWDAAVDCRNPWKSTMFTPEYFGGNGNPQNNYCVEDGFAKTWTYIFPDNACLKRQFEGEKVSWQCPEWTTSLLQTVHNYTEFNEMIERSIHYSVHRLVGGEAGDLTYSWSPHDPLLWMHHSNMDRVWAKWQMSNDWKACDFNGIGYRVDTKMEFEAHLTDPLSMYKNRRVAEFMKLGFGVNCYTYDQFLPENTANKRSIARARLEQALSPENLERYFPEWAKGTANPFHDDLHDIWNPAYNLGDDHPFAEPFRRKIMSHDFYTVQAAEDAFVDMLKESKYRSPYNDATHEILFRDYTSP